MTHALASETQQGYFYEGMHRARLDVKKLFKNRKHLYKHYTNIVNDRSDRMLRQNLYATTY